jgi:hypothetical protein
MPRCSRRATARPRDHENPKLDATDFYAFNSYETGRDGYVTFVADYIPLEDAYGGPNYFTLDPDAVYDIKIDNNGDAREDLTFRFQFEVKRKNIALTIGPEEQSADGGDSPHPGRRHRRRGRRGPQRQRVVHLSVVAPTPRATTGTPGG